MAVNTWKKNSPDTISTISKVTNKQVYSPLGRIMITWRHFHPEQRNPIQGTKYNCKRLAKDKWLFDVISTMSKGTKYNCKRPEEKYNYLTSFPPWAKEPNTAVSTWRKENKPLVSGWSWTCSLAISLFCLSDSTVSLGVVVFVASAASELIENIYAKHVPFWVPIFRVQTRLSVLHNRK